MNEVLLNHHRVHQAEKFPRCGFSTFREENERDTNQYKCDLSEIIISTQNRPEHKKETKRDVIYGGIGQPWGKRSPQVTVWPKFSSSPCLFS